MNLIVRMSLSCALIGNALALTAAAAGLPQVARAAPAQLDGATIFRQRCQVCHTARAGKPSPFGPNLAGVVGRKAASLAFNYSVALKRSGLVWDRASLDRYLAAPGRLVPGTRMTVSLSDTKQRKELIAYLAQTR
jgi:cytochrome c